MNWPWISQDSVLAIMQIGNDAVRVVEKRWEQRYNELLDKYHDLKLKGAAPVVPDLPVRQPLSTDLADEEAAMDEEAKPVEVGLFRDDD